MQSNCERRLTTTYTFPSYPVIILFFFFVTLLPVVFVGNKMTVGERRRELLPVLFYNSQLLRYAGTSGIVWLFSLSCCRFIAHVKLDGLAYICAVWDVVRGRGNR
jgi:hypothetical protein